ncbi:FecCD family ABC transporter permease [Cohnella sp. GCM10027633]|uniref:FecCD family ABC transporter permease n=1 Tax=unclassified Cohnella TaxID=2636738 RepID=UPI0036418CBA
MTDAKLRRFALVNVAVAALIVLVFLISLNSGLIRLSPKDVFATLFGQGTGEQELILFDFRMPRILIALLIGMGLAVSGAILQGITRNDLADPGIMGINAGAGLAVLLFFAYYPINQAAPALFVPMIAFAGGFAAALLIYVLSIKKGEGISPMRLILMGIAVAAGISAATFAISIRLDAFTFNFVNVWLAGSIWATGYKHVLVLLPWILILIPLAIYRSRSLNVISLHEHVAVGLGSSVSRQRFFFLAVAVALAASSVAIGGTIGFVGLIAPHVARRLVGPQHQYLIVTSAFIGGLLLLLADTIARYGIESTEIPTGIVAAVIGAPYFIYLLMKRV